MSRSLFFICPTDCLEPVINSCFGGENYYYASLGNSVPFDKDTLNQIGRLIQRYDISEISFVLSETNPIVKDALGNQIFSDIRGMTEFYETVLEQKSHAEVLTRTCNRLFTVLSFFLNKKIGELQHALERAGLDKIQINGKIYDKGNREFYKIYSELVCSKYFSLN